MIRLYTINILCFSITAVVLADLGANFLTWRFWVVMLLLVGIQINNSIYPSK